MEKLYKMKLHEQITPRFDGENVKITRVPGGWIYSFFDLVITGEPGAAYDNWIGRSVFVPFDNEFQVCSDSDQDGF